MLLELGGFLGAVIIFFYALAVLNYVLKFINKNFRDLLKKNEKFYTPYMRLMKFMIKSHKFFGFGTIIFILLHFYIQLTYLYLSISGVIASCMMLLQIFLGMYLLKTKQRRKLWLNLHRTVAVFVLVFVIIHITGLFQL